MEPFADHPRTDFVPLVRSPGGYWTPASATSSVPIDLSALVADLLTPVDVPLARRD